MLWSYGTARPPSLSPVAGYYEFNLGRPLHEVIGKPSADTLDSPDPDRRRDGHDGGRPEQGRVAG
jgi:hypothetical protein